MRFALAQLMVSEDPAVNVTSAAAAIRRAAAAGARVVVLPEATLAPFGTDLRAAARDHAAAFDEAVTVAAEETGVLAVVGSFTEADDGRVRNTLIARGHGLRVDYDKIHLFDAFGTRESDTIAPGEALRTIDVDGWRLGLATCYDVRFPEQFQALAERGAHAVLLPAAWADGPGKEDQWRLLLRARALDATVFVLAADQAPPPGPASATRGVGHSAVISPLGTRLDELGRAEGLLIADLDRDEVWRARESLPVLRHRVQLPPAEDSASAAHH